MVVFSSFASYKAGERCCVCALASKVSGSRQTSRQGSVRGRRGTRHRGSPVLRETCREACFCCKQDFSFTTLLYARNWKHQEHSDGFCVHSEKLVLTPGVRVPQDQGPGFSREFSTKNSLNVCLAGVSVGRRTGCREMIHDVAESSSEPPKGLIVKLLLVILSQKFRTQWVNAIDDSHPSFNQPASPRRMTRRRGAEHHLSFRWNSVPIAVIYHRRQSVFQWERDIGSARNSPAHTTSESLSPHVTSTPRPRLANI